MCLCVEPLSTALTSLNGLDELNMSSGAFLTSSISSALVGSTIHRPKVGILNRPGLA